MNGNFKWTVILLIIAVALLAVALYCCSLQVSEPAGELLNEVRNVLV